MSNASEPTRVVPNLSLNGRAREAIETWSRAFGAVEVVAYPAEDGRIQHAEVEINGGPVFLTDFNMDGESGFTPTRSIALHLAVLDGSKWMERGEAGGCQVLTPWQTMSFGGFGRLLDPFGVVWAIATPNDL